MTLQARQTTHQRLLLAPNVTLALEVLRMPIMELQAFLEHETEENPCLELDDPAYADGQGECGAPEAPLAHGSGLPDEEWLAHWRTAAEREPLDEDADDEWRREPRAAPVQTLSEALRLDVGCQSGSTEERAAGELIIAHLDRFGYLGTPLDELVALSGVPRERLERALRLVQQLDPPGIAARDLRECLLLQLERAGERETLAYEILERYFGLFIERRLEAISRATGRPLVQVAGGVERIRRLNPKPGGALTGEPSPALIPDLVIHHREQHYDVELNEHEIPRVAISRTYHRMAKDPQLPEEAREFLLTRIRRANWLIRAIDERNATVLAIARCLISLQREFLEQGRGAIRPLTQAQVAMLVGRHPSTVSRAVAGKTIDTPHGVLRLEQLFASQVPQAAPNAGVSDARVKSEIQRLIDEEDPRHPLSDAALATRMAEREITVARRTIAKYRVSLNILPTHLRKRHRRAVSPVP